MRGVRAKKLRKYFHAHYGDKPNLEGHPKFLWRRFKKFVAYAERNKV